MFLFCFEEFWFLVFVIVRGCSDGKLNCRGDAVVVVSFFLSLQVSVVTRAGVIGFLFASAFAVLCF